MIKDFRKILSLVNSESFYEIEKYWQSIDITAFSKSKSPIDKSVNGLYALWQPQFGIIYIGKGKPIFKRLKSHQNATLGKEKATAWKQFFEHKLINTEIKIYWFKLDNANEFIAEQSREALERLLQIKYEPLFDKLYPKGNHKEIDLDEALIKIYGASSSKT